MSFNPGQLLNDPTLFMNNPALRRNAPAPAEPAAPVAPPQFDPGLYNDAYRRLGMLSIANVVDLGCGAGNFAATMLKYQQPVEMYMGVDVSHKQISTAKAAYPGWNFLYGDVYDQKIKAEYERYGGYLMLNFLEYLPDDLGFLDTIEPGKPMVFSAPTVSSEGVLRVYGENRDVYERYSTIVSIKSIGLYRNSEQCVWRMVTAIKW